MAKYRDHTKSKLVAKYVKYNYNELSKERHDRRFQINVDNQSKLINYCKGNRFSLSIKNNNEHWVIKQGLNIIEWWPRTAKLIINKHWKKGIHVHDISQIISYLNFFKLLKIKE